MRFETMSVKSLEKLIADATEALQARRAAAKEELKIDIIKRLDDNGLTVEDVFGIRKRGALKGSKVAVKYRDRANPENTWTGRGRQPKWLSAALKKGAKLEAFALNGSR